MEATVFKARASSNAKTVETLNGETPSKGHRRLGTDDGCMSPSRDFDQNNSIVLLETTARDQITIDHKQKHSKEGPFASFLRACKESSIAYETRSEAPAQFKIALDKSCQLMSAEDEHIIFQSLHSRYHFYCDNHGFEFQEGQLTPDALAEYNLQYTSDGNGKVFGLKMVTPEEETVELTPPSTSTSVSHNLEAQLFGDNLPPRPKWHK